MENRGFEQFSVELKIGWHLAGPEWILMAC